MYVVEEGWKVLEARVYMKAWPVVRFLACTREGMHRLGLDEGPRQGTYLVLDVLQGIRRVDGEAYEDHMGFGISEGAQPLVVFLACSVP